MTYISGVKRKQIEDHEDEGYFLIKKIRILKRRKFKTHSLPVIINNADWPFIEIFVKYADELDDDKELFPMSRNRAYQILEEVGLYPHYLRHLRLTLLTREHNLTNEDLAKYIGWADGRMASKYVHSDLKYVIGKLGGRIKNAKQN
jgi:hypothetical protein